ncbi:MAG: hypothetical protein O2968_21855 [Acidobacteria bacterium]|nr:hypothetical protein [Acidobacteriota bacterium]
MTNPALGGEDHIHIALRQNRPNRARCLTCVESALFDPLANRGEFSGRELGSGLRHASRGGHAEQQTVVGLAGHNGRARFAALEQRVPAHYREIGLSAFLAMATRALCPQDRQDLGLESRSRGKGSARSDSRDE